MDSNNVAKTVVKTPYYCNNVVLTICAGWIVSQA